MVAGACNVLNLPDANICKGTLVAGMRNHQNLPNSEVCKVKLVAGVGFEPTTFRL